MKRMMAKNRYNLQMLLIMVVIYLGINGITSWFYYQNYCDSIDVIAQLIVDDGRSRVDIATDILKDFSMQSVAQGKQILKSYGYRKVERMLYFTDF